MMNKTQLKIKHHYVPVCYLGGFTEVASKSNCLHVLDLDTMKSWKDLPKNVACENDYNSVDGDLPADAFEDSFAEIEAATAPIWHRMIETKTVPTDPEELHWLMNFLTLLLLRTKPSRKLIDDMYLACAQGAIDLVTSTPERFESQIKQMQDAGIDMPELNQGIPLEQIRQSMRDGSLEMSVENHNNYYLIKMGEQSVKVLEVLHARNWAIWDFTDTEVNLFTSDDPVSVVWNKPTPQIHPAGFGLSGTLAIIPLTTNLALIGAFERELLVTKTSSLLARRVNGVTLGHAFRFIYSSDDSRKATIANESGDVEVCLDSYLKKRVDSNRHSHQHTNVHRMGSLIRCAAEKVPNYINLTT